MANNESLEQYRKNRFIEVRKTLKKLSELIAFFAIYGPVYDNNYNCSISKINDISECYLKNLDSKIIDKMYESYINGKKENKKEKEIFEQLKKFLYNFKTSIITENNNRSRRRK